MSPRTRALELSALEIGKMSDGEVLECLERVLSMYRWYIFPDVNPSRAIRLTSKRAALIREATRLATAGTLLAIAKRIEKGRKE
jgi:hypothetical protein